MLKLRVCGHRELEHIYSLLELDFDKKELLPKLNIHRAMLRGDLELLAVTDEETKIDAAYALVGCRGLYGYVWLKYLDVIPWYREKGLGVEAMRLLNRRYADKQGIIAELTDFSGEGEGDTLRKQMKFFRRFGYEEVESGLRLGGVEDHVMVKPIRGTAEIGPLVRRILRDFYGRVLSPWAMEKMIEL